MCATARANSARLDSLLPPRAGIARTPTHACPVKTLTLGDQRRPCCPITKFRRMRHAGFVAGHANRFVDLLAGFFSLQERRLRRSGMTEKECDCWREKACVN